MTLSRLPSGWFMAIEDLCTEPYRKLPCQNECVNLPMLNGLDSLSYVGYHASEILDLATLGLILGSQVDVVGVQGSPKDNASGVAWGHCCLNS